MIAFFLTPAGETSHLGCCVEGLRRASGARAPAPLESFMARCCGQPAVLFSLRFCELLARFAGAALSGRRLSAEEDQGRSMDTAGNEHPGLRPGGLLRLGHGVERKLHLPADAEAHAELLTTRRCSACADWHRLVALPLEARILARWWRASPAQLFHRFMAARRMVLRPLVLGRPLFQVLAHSSKEQ